MRKSVSIIILTVFILLFNSNRTLAQSTSETMRQMHFFLQEKEYDGHKMADVDNPQPALGGVDETPNFTMATTAVPTLIAATDGTPQSASPSTAFAVALEATVHDANGDPLSGVNVIFTAPTSGATGTFTGAVSLVTVVTDNYGVAIAPTFTSNATLGSFTVTATVTGISDAANFSLANGCPSTIVTSNADSGPGTLRDIIATACPNSTITFDPSVSSIALTSGDIAIDQAITINGPGANLLAISGSHLSRIFIITAGNFTVSISGVTIKDGKPQIGASNYSNGGGGILINSGTVNISNCSITNNDASLTTYAEGGGIDNENGIVTIDHCSITNNISSEDGGGIVQFSSFKMVVNNSTIAGNIANGAYDTDGWGGGIFLYYDSLLITNSTIFGNTGFTLGGNILSYFGILAMGNTIVGGGSLNSPTSTTSDYGMDIYNGNDIASNGYNIVQKTGGYTLTATNNMQGISPKMLPLGNYGGAMPTLVPMCNSVAINAGPPTLTTGTDQRGKARYIGGRADIGAVETNYAASITNGSPQSASVNSAFITALQTGVTESGNAIAGDSVTFTAPATGVGGTFSTASGPSITVTVTTNAGGIAIAPTFTANSNAGDYIVTSKIGTGFPTYNYNLTNSLVLPVTFGAVTATVINCTAQIQWETLTESNTKDFVVEYSADGVHYNPLATLAAQGTSSIKHDYRYTHTSLVQGINYYRIKQTDLDGAFTYSSVVIVANACNNAAIMAYPNPVKNNLIVVLPGTDRQTITITDAIGRRMSQYIVNGGTNIINANDWARGMYSLTVTKDGNTTFVLKLIKD